MVSETRDYLGALVDVQRVDAATGRPLPGATDAELAAMAIREEDAFDEGAWVAAALEVRGPRRPRGFFCCCALLLFCAAVGMRAQG